MTCCIDNMGRERRKVLPSQIIESHDRGRTETQKSYRHINNNNQISIVLLLISIYQNQNDVC